MAHVVLSTNPFDPQNDAEFVQVERVCTIREWLEGHYRDFVEFSVPTICLHNGQAVMRKDWTETRIEKDDVVNFVAVPGDGGATFFIISLLISVASVVVSLSVSIPEVNQVDRDEGDPVYNLRGQRNQVKIGAPIECVFGRNRLFPSYAAAPYTKYQSNDQWLFQLFCLGHGEFDIERVQIEDTPVADFEDVFATVYGPGQEVTEFPDNVVTSDEVDNIELVGSNESTVSNEERELSPGDPDQNIPRTTYTATATAGPYVANPANTTATRLEVDVSFPRGLYSQNDEGELESVTVTANFEMQRIDAAGEPIDGAGWAQFAFLNHTAKTVTPQRITIGGDVPAARYRVRARRTNAESDSHRVGDTLRWEELRAYLPNVNRYSGVTMLAVRARASNNLNSNSSARVNVIATRKLPVYSNGAWTAPMSTRSPVWALCEIFRANYGPALAENSYFDLTGLATWATVIQTRGDNFDWVFDRNITAWDAAKIALNVIRAIPILRGTKIGLVRDQAQTLSSAIFGPQNMLAGSFKHEIEFHGVETYDGLEVSYIDPETWLEEVVPCLVGTDAGTHLERVTLQGCHDRTQAYRWGMWKRANERYRREQIVFTTGMEGYIPSYGDLIGVSHDVPQWGQSGCVKNITPRTNGQTLWLDHPVQFGGQFQAHRIQIRKRDGSATPPLACFSINNPMRVKILSTLDLADYDFSDENERPLFTFGIAQNYNRRCVIANIQPRGEEEILVTAFPYRAEPHSYDTTAAPAIGETNGALLPRLGLPEVRGLVVVRAPESVNEVIATWVPVRGAQRYIIEISYSGEANSWEQISSEIKTSTFRFTVIPGIRLYVRVAALNDAQGEWAYWVDVPSLTATNLLFDNGNTPTFPGGLMVVPSFGSILLQWTLPINTNIRQTNIYASMTANRPTEPTLIAEDRLRQITHGMLDAGATWNYWFEAVSLGGLKSPIVGPRTGTTLANLTNDVAIYKRASSLPDLPTADVVWTFATRTATGLTNGWTTAIPADDGDPLYISLAVSSGEGETDTIEPGEWSAPVIFVMAGEGEDGTNTARASLYVRTHLPNSPNKPTAPIIYTFADGSMSGITQGWAKDLPLSGGSYRWLIEAAAVSNEATDTIDADDWNTPALLSEDGFGAVPPFAPGVIGGTGDFLFTLNHTGSAVDSGEIRVRATTFTHPDGTVYEPQMDSIIRTSYGDNLTHGRFFLMWTVTDPDTRWPTNSDWGTNDNIVPVVKGSGNQWIAVDDTGSTFTFTPLATDCILAAVGADTTASGLNRLQIFTNGAKGEQGDPGLPGLSAFGVLPKPFNGGRIGGTSDMAYFDDQNLSGAADLGEIRITGTYFDHPDGTRRSVIPTTWVVLTTYGEGTHGDFWLMWTDERPSDRWEIDSDDNDSEWGNAFVVPIVAGNGNEWIAVDNEGHVFPFEPRATDCIIAAVRADTVESGITRILALNVGSPGERGPIGPRGFPGDPGTDGLDGIGRDGAYHSWIYRNAATRPNTPTGGSYDGTTETTPTDWSDEPEDRVAGELTWVSKGRFTDPEDDGDWDGSVWSRPIKWVEPGERGPRGEGSVVNITTLGTWDSTVDGHSWRKADGDDDNDSWTNCGFRSTLAFRNAAWCQFKRASTSDAVVVGLTRGNLTTISRDIIDYSIRINGQGNITLTTGANVLVIPTSNRSETADDIFSIVHDGNTVSYYRNDDLLLGYSIPPGTVVGQLHLKGIAHHVGARIDEIDYFPGAPAGAPGAAGPGRLTSSVYRNSTAQPATPSGGSYDGTDETVPSSWTAQPTTPSSPTIKRWISTCQYIRNVDGTWTRDPEWSSPAEHFRAGTPGQNGTDGIDGRTGAYRSFIYRNATNRPNRPQGGTYSGSQATETFPNNWDDDPVFSSTQRTWRSQALYTQNANGSWTGGNWSQPTQFLGVDGRDGRDGMDASLASLIALGSNVNIVSGHEFARTGVNDNWNGGARSENPIIGPFQITCRRGTQSDVIIGFTEMTFRNRTSNLNATNIWIYAMQVNADGSVGIYTGYNNTYRIARPAMGNSEPPATAILAVVNDGARFYGAINGSIIDELNNSAVADVQQQPMYSRFAIKDAGTVMGDIHFISTGIRGEAGTPGADGEDIFGLDGSFHSFIFRTTTGFNNPGRPTGGSWNGTVEVVPNDWFDNPTVGGENQRVWVSGRKYVPNTNGPGFTAGQWSFPVQWDGTDGEGIKAIAVVDNAVTTEAPSGFTSLDPPLRLVTTRNGVVASIELQIQEQFAAALNWTSQFQIVRAAGINPSFGSFISISPQYVPPSVGGGFTKKAGSLTVTDLVNGDYSYEVRCHIGNSGGSNAITDATLVVRQ